MTRTGATPLLAAAAALAAAANVPPPTTLGSAAPPPLDPGAVVHLRVEVRVDTARGPRSGVEFRLLCGEPIGPRTHSLTASAWRAVAKVAGAAPANYQGNEVCRSCRARLA